MQYDRAVPTTVRWCFYLDVECLHDSDYDCSTTYDDITTTGDPVVTTENQCEKLPDLAGYWTVKVSCGRRSVFDINTILKVAYLKYTQPTLNINILKVFLNTI